MYYGGVGSWREILKFEVVFVNISGFYRPCEDAVADIFGNG